MKSFIIQILTGPWLGVFGSILITSTSGTNYMFSLYSGDIKAALGYDQTTLNLLGFFKDLGNNVGIFTGLIAEIAPVWFILSFGAVLNFFGNFMIWLSVTKKLAMPTVWQMCLYMCIGANSQTFSFNGGIVPSVKNFSQSRGIILGILTGYIGLSGAIMTQLYHAMCGENSRQLILLIAWLPTAIALFFALIIRIIKVSRDQTNDRKVLYKFLYISLGLAAFLMIIIIVEKNFAFTQGEYGGAAAVVVILLFLPVAIVINEELKIWKAKRDPLNDPSPVKVIVDDENSTLAPITTTSSSNDQANASISCWKTAFKPPNRGEDYTILQALFSVDMLLLFLATISGIGGISTTINNLDQIGDSQGYPRKSISTFVSLVSIWNYLGRVASGFLSEIFLTKYKFPRPSVLAFVMLLSCLGHLLIAFNVSGSLYIASVIIGFCFGAQWPLLFAIILDIFGLKYYSTLFNFGVLASPIGSYIFNVRVVGYLYDVEGRKKMAARGMLWEAGRDLNCSGTKCFKLSFIIITAATLLGAFFSFILALRTWNFYKSDIYKKFSMEPNEAKMEMQVTGNGVVDCSGGNNI